MKFENLSQYLLFNPTCPFCCVDLGVEAITSLRDNSLTISDSERRADGIHYVLSAMIPYEDYFTDFKVTLRINGKLSYTEVNPKSHEKTVKRKNFIEAFNASHTQIWQSCTNKDCKLKYMKQSSPLFLDEEGLNPPQLYCETFEFDNCVVSNNYIDDITEIYVGDEPTPPIKIKFYELTEKSAPFVFDRIKISTVFS